MNAGAGDDVRSLTSTRNAEPETRNPFGALP
jgi:hypothetical protein